MSNISLALLNLKLQLQFKGKHTTLTPDDLYRHYIQYLPLLSSNEMTWWFSLVTLFHSFPVDLQNTISKEGCKSLIFPSSIQVTLDYCSLKFEGISSTRVKILTDESKLIKTLFSSHLNSRSHSNLNHVHFHFSSFKAGTTITQYSKNASSLDSTKHLVVK